MCVCVCVCVNVCMYVCALDKEPSGAGSWFVAQCYMVRLAPHWHAVKWVGIIAFAITIGHLYL